MITAPQPMPLSTAKPERESWLGFIARTRYFSVSLIVHVMIVAVFGTIILNRAAEDPAEFISEADLFAPPDSLPIAPDERPIERVPEPAGGEVTENKISNPSMSPITTMANSTFTINATPNLNGLLNNLGKSAMGTNGGPGGIGRGWGKGGGTGVKLFGAKANVQDVVLVLDVSSSMIGAPKSVKTYEVLEREACNVIRGLKDVNKFGVVVFSKEAKVYQETLVKAHSDEKARAISWLKSMSPMRAKEPGVEADIEAFHHGTRADLGLAAAFLMQPDVIFFVSDGEPTGVTVPVILTQVQEKQTASTKFTDIHAIAYLADSGQQFMKDLAAQNRGTFTEVNPKDVK